MKGTTHNQNEHKNRPAEAQELGKTMLSGKTLKPHQIQTKKYCTE
jgi:hypothetical protein